MIAKFVISEAIESMGQELNRDIVEKIKQIKQKMALLELSSPEASNLADYCKKLNKERINALQLKLIPGGNSL